MNTLSPDAIRAETVTLIGDGGDEIEAYRATPPRRGLAWRNRLDPPHARLRPGDQRIRPTARRRRLSHGVPESVLPRSPRRRSRRRRRGCARGGRCADERLVGDVAGAVEHLRTLPGANGRFGVIGHCSGGRHAYLAACSLPFDAVVDCYGAFIVEDPPEGIPKALQPILGLAPDLSCPMLGLFGVEDRFPSPDAVAALDAELTRLDKPHEFHSYDGAGHSFFSVDRPAYRPEAALDGWRRIDRFFATHLKG